MDPFFARNNNENKPPADRLQVPPQPPADVFLSAVMVIFFLTLAAADYVGFVPDYIDGEQSQTKPQTTSGSNSKIALSDLPQLGEKTPTGVLPERIEINAIGMDLPIQNPATRDIDKLTQALVSGPARYVDSAKLGEKGNMIVFGHSSRLPIVRNQMYKAFNRVSELKPGDAVYVYGEDGKIYLYIAASVRIADAEEDVISLSKDSTRLTLVTCNVLGEKTSRFIVEADFIGILPA